MQLEKDRQLNMVIGYPLSHSQSVLLHNTVYQHVGMNSIMLAQPHPELKALIQAIKTLSVELTAVTMPFKEEVFQYLKDCSPEVNILKTANTLIQRNGQLYGYNTDIAGIAFAFSGVNLHGKQVLVMGAGGAARVMGYFLKINKAKIIWMNRNPKKATALAEEFGGVVIISDKLSMTDASSFVNTMADKHLNRKKKSYFLTLNLRAPVFALKGFRRRSKELCRDISPKATCLGIVENEA